MKLRLCALNNDETPRLFLELQSEADATLISGLLFNKGMECLGTALGKKEGFELLTVWNDISQEKEKIFKKKKTNSTDN